MTHSAAEWFHSVNFALIIIVINEKQNKLNYTPFNNNNYNNNNNNIIVQLNMLSCYTTYTRL